jgi:O-antigen/teichoic acid export membrane protein
LVFRNFLTLSVGEVIARAMHVLAVILLARALKPEAFGIFELALAVTSYALLVVQQGFDVIATREVARDPRRESRWLGAIVRLRLVLALAVTAGVVALASIIGWKRPLSGLLVLFTASYFANALTLRWRFLALEQPRPPAAASVLSQIVFLSTVVFFVRAPEDAWRAVIGWVAGELVAALILWSARRPEPKMHNEPLVPRKVLLLESLPITVSLLLGQIMYNFDVLALASMGKVAEIGLYLAAYRCATGFAPLLGQLQASIFPQFARDHADPAELSKSSWKLAIWAGLAGFAIAAVLTVEATVLMDLLFGREYRAAVPFLRILVWILPVQFARAILRQVLLASHLQLSDTRNVALGAITNIALDLALVRSWGAFGCSVSTLCSEFVLLLGSWQAARSRVAPRTP